MTLSLSNQRSISPVGLRQGWTSPFYNESHKRFRAAMREFVDKEVRGLCLARFVLRFRLPARRLNACCGVSCARSLRSATSGTRPRSCRARCGASATRPAGCPVRRGFPDSTFDWIRHVSCVRLRVFEQGWWEHRGPRSTPARTSPAASSLKSSTPSVSSIQTLSCLAPFALLDGSHVAWVWYADELILMDEVARCGSGGYACAFDLRILPQTDFLHTVALQRPVGSVRWPVDRPAARAALWQPIPQGQGPDRFQLFLLSIANLSESHSCVHLRL